MRFKLCGRCPREAEVLAFLARWADVLNPLHDEARAEVVLMPVPFAATVSYGGGAEKQVAELESWITKGVDGLAVSSSSTDALLEALAHHGRKTTFDSLRHVVETNDKKRFAFNEDFTRIRASQGHSVEVDLAYAAEAPPEVLHHGTAERFLDSIRVQGLCKRERHHVHLRGCDQMDGLHCPW